MLTDIIVTLVTFTSAAKTVHPRHTSLRSSCYTGALEHPACSAMSPKGQSIVCFRVACMFHGKTFP